jgi:hypothetical protein
MAVRLEKALPILGEKIKRPLYEGPIRAQIQGGRFEGLAKYGPCKMGMQVSYRLYTQIPEEGLVGQTDKTGGRYIPSIIQT